MEATSCLLTSPKRSHLFSVDVGNDWFFRIFALKSKADEAAYEDLMKTNSTEKMNKQN